MSEDGKSVVGAGNNAAPPQLDSALCLRLTGFVSFLRANGFALGIDDATLLVEAASYVGVFDQSLLRWSARALLCRRAADRHRFEQLFDSWFLRPNKRQYVESRTGGTGSLDRSDKAFTSENAGRRHAGSGE